MVFRKTVSDRQKKIIHRQFLRQSSYRLRQFFSPIRKKKPTGIIHTYSAWSPITRIPSAVCVYILIKIESVHHRLQFIRCRRRASAITRSRDDSYDTELTGLESFHSPGKRTRKTQYKNSSPRYKLIRYRKKQRVCAVQHF